VLVASGCVTIVQGRPADSPTNPTATPSTVSSDDLNFARTAFLALVRGDNSAEDFIDWETFRVSDQNVGVMYLALPNDTERAGFRHGYLTQFSASFLRAAGTSSVDNFDNWRIASSDSVRYIVAVDAASGRTISITVSLRNGQRRIAALDVR
jgi:hypothetical protein